MGVKGRLQKLAVQAACAPVWAVVGVGLGAKAILKPRTFFQRTNRAGLEWQEVGDGIEHTFFTTSTGIRLHAITSDLNSNKPLALLLHGFPETSHSWRFQLPVLRETHAVVALDMKGFGASDKPKGVEQYSISVLVEEVADVIRAAQRSSADVIAHDWGGMVAWHLAVAHPQMVRRLVILCSPHPHAYKDPACFTSKQARRLWYMMLFQSKRLGRTYLAHSDYQRLEAWLRKSPQGVKRAEAISDQDIEHYKAALSQPGSLDASLRYYHASLHDSTVGQDLLMLRALREPVPVPVLLLYADRDEAFLPTMFQGYDAFVPDLQTLCLDNCSHWAQQDRPDQVNEAILQFFASKRCSYTETPLQAAAVDSARSLTPGKLASLGAPPAARSARKESAPEQDGGTLLHVSARAASSEEEEDADLREAVRASDELFVSAALAAESELGDALSVAEEGVALKKRASALPPPDAEDVGFRDGIGSRRSQNPENFEDRRIPAVRAQATWLDAPRHASSAEPSPRGKTRGQLPKGFDKHIQRVQTPPKAAMPGMRPPSRTATGSKAR